MGKYREKKLERKDIRKIINEIDNILYGCFMFSKIVNFSTYENAYMRLSRQEQIKVLELSRKLAEMLQNKIKFKINEKYVKNYLRCQDNEKTIFDKFESNHYHFDILSQNKIDEIHKRGNLTPEEKYKEWVSHGLCAPGDGMGGATWRCLKYGNCTDCLIAYAMEREEWPSIEFVYRDLIKEDKEIMKSMFRI